MYENNLANKYKAFGFSFSSDILFPELRDLVSLGGNQIDIEIRYADLFQEWSENGEIFNRYIFTKDNVMFRLPDLGIFLIKGGRQILVSPDKNASLDQIRLYVLGTCMGAVLLQRKILSLHGSAIEIDGSAYAIVGESGAGKSTLAASFIKEGYKLLSDDVIPVVLSENDLPVVIPSYPSQKLWENSIRDLGMDATLFKPIYNREKKYSIPVSNFSYKNVPLRGVFELTKTSSDNISLSKLSGLECFKTLTQHTYRNEFISKMCLNEWHFKTSSSFLTTIKLYKLSRPINRFSAEQLRSLIINTISKEINNDQYYENQYV
ncbi:ATP-binding cassette domain-containing protein [Metabacillus indicus]|uniref:HPr kinase/phosphorylase C-terminal domain-containing protein n=1 Tax=Metabacillus indicus TaxID=246786 RepID=A0A084H4G4_METID|nr:ATP-binding cassette domain-containing protein [Metabacillus indicus]KEZ50320.1 hypothetical protein AZ46_0206430 [Metabacillus indicus LMG 22858]KEZ54476.1 hypothetical protein GS18_0206105 [Metabacillus indicus]